MEVILVILLVFLIAPPTLLQTFDSEYRLQCTKEELGIRWPSYVNSGNYYVCQSERGNQLKISCASGDLFSFVLQVCTPPENHIPPPPLDALPTSRPTLSSPADEPLPIVPWLPKPLAPKEPLTEPPYVSASDEPRPPHVSQISEHKPPNIDQQPPLPLAVGQQQVATEQQPTLHSETPPPSSPIGKPASIPQGTPEPKPSSTLNVPSRPQPPSGPQPSFVPQPPFAPQPPSVAQPPSVPQPAPVPQLPTVPRPSFVAQPPSVSQSASALQPTPSVPRPPLVQKPPVRKPKVPLPPTPPPTPPVVKTKNIAPGALTKSKPPLPPRRKMLSVPVKRNKN